jgi:hypothetical protein
VVDLFEVVSVVGGVAVRGVRGVVVGVLVEGGGPTAPKPPFKNQFDLIIFRLKYLGPSTDSVDVQRRPGPIACGEMAVWPPCADDRGHGGAEPRVSD